MQNITASLQPLAQEQECPGCRAIIPVHPEYVAWCDSCGWNLQPQESPRSRTLFESLYAKIGERSSQALFDEVVKAEALKPRLTPSKALAFTFSALIHALTLVFAVLGVTLLLKGWPNVFAILGALCCLSGAWAVRPRPAPFPDALLAREKTPTLYKIADDVARTLGVRPVSGIVFSWQFNASFSQHGWRRKSILHLGLPLFTILEGQEKIALIAHELAHGVNGDASRGVFIGSALDSLAQWYKILLPRSMWVEEYGILNIIIFPFIVMLLGLANLAKLGIYVLIHLLWRNSQRAEYLADYLAARIGGTDAALSLLDKLHLGSALSLTLTRANWASRRRTFLAEFRQKVANLPARELERVRRVELLQGTRLDVTHPPTAHRIAFLKAHPFASPSIVLSSVETEQLERELATL
jgi:Zn-dependent protease with chaperone function